MANKKTNKVESVDLEHLSNLSGEKDTRTAPSFKLPSLKLNGRDGGYFKTVIGKDGELEKNEEGKALLVEVKNPVGIILKPRKSFSYECPSYQLFSSEGNVIPKAVFTVFKKVDGVKGPSITMVGQGTSAELKTKFPELKMTQVVYFLSDEGDLMRLKIHGMSLGQIFNYFKDFGSDEHFFQYKTILGQKSDKNQYGKFFVSTFKRGEKVKDFTAVKENLELINEKISAIEAYSAEQNAMQEDFSGGNEEITGSRPESSPLDKINTGKWEEESESVGETVGKKKKTVQDEQDEIDVDSIPF